MLPGAAWDIWQEGRGTGHKGLYHGISYNHLCHNCIAAAAAVAASSAAADAVVSAAIVVAAAAAITAAISLRIGHDNGHCESEGWDRLVRAAGTTLTTA